MLLRCYRDGKDPKTPDGWLDTGDVGEVHDGRLVVHGRAEEVIVTGGEKVWPAPLEDTVRACPEVRDVAVVGRPDPEWGERVVAIVVPADHRHPPSLLDIRAWVKTNWPAYCAPKELWLAAALPRTASGKLRRSLLRSSVGVLDERPCRGWPCATE